MTRFFGRLKKRLMPFFDMTAWVLLIVCTIPLLIIDSGMVLTLFQWTAFGLALAANGIVLCRLMVPQVDLTEWLTLAKGGMISAAIVVAAILFLLAMIFVGLVLWAKA